MLKFLAAFNGYKSYLVAFATVLYGAVEWGTGAMSQDQAMAFIFTGSGLAALRHGVSGSVITIVQQLLPAVLQAVQQATAPAAPAPTPAAAPVVGKVSAILVAAVLAGLTLVGCAAQPIEAQLATACNQIATAYREAAVLRANGKLSPAAIASVEQTVPVALASCDPSHPPADLQTSVASVTAALQQITLASAGVH